MTIGDVRARDVLLSQAASSIQTQIPTALKGTRFEKTSEVLSSLVTSMESLKAGILDLAETGNVYGTNVLFRVFLEHMLKTLAIFMKASDEGSDDFAEQFIRLRVHEAHEYRRAFQTAGLDISAGHKSVLDAWFTDAQKMSNKQLDEIAAPFRYRALIETIARQTETMQPSFLSKIIPNYSELSGFVHGGPSAALILNALRTEELKSTHLEQIAELVVSMFFSAHRWLLMLAMTVRPEFQTAHDQLDEAIHRLQ